MPEIDRSPKSKRRMEVRFLRLLLILGLISILATVVMQANALRFKPVAKLPVGMNSIGIAMELVQSKQDVLDLTADPENRKMLRAQQQLDRFLFIPSYFFFFATLGAYGIVVLDRMRFSGYAITVLVSLAALFDYFEDSGIIYALDHLEDPQPQHIWIWGYLKWGLLYAMLIGTLPLFWRRWKSASLRILGFPFGLYAVFSGAAGVVACCLRHGGRVESAATGLAAPILFFVLFAALFQFGVVRGLTAIALFLRGFAATRWIVLWPTWKAGKDHPSAV